MEFKQLLARFGLSQAEFCRIYEVPRSTLQDWCADKSKIAPYWLKLLKADLERRFGNNEKSI